jgi:AcrR family transcriptional regulator
MDLRSERGVATRTQVLATATRLFAEKGYEDVSIELILKECGISKGALYHHFRNKEAVFEAALEGVEARIVETVASRSKSAANPLDALRLGCGAWLDLVASDEVVRRMAVIDAPAVLGWHAWREMEGRYALGLLRNALAMAASLGCLEPDRVEACASMLLASLNEMAMLIARADNRDRVIADARHVIELLVSRLIGVDPGAPWASRGDEHLG